MQCRNCGTEIADKALICYRCGTATTEAKYKPAPRSRVGAVGFGGSVTFSAIVIGVLALLVLLAFFLLHS